MQKKSAGKMESARIFLEGVKSYNENPGNQAFNKKLITEVETALNLSNGINSDIEALKVKIDKKKNELSGHLENIGKLLKEAKKFVQKNFPRKSWKNFGIVSK